MSVTRRSALKGGAAVAAGLGILGSGILAAAPQQADAAIADNTKTTDSIWAVEELNEPVETITADICVVGGGGVGLAAAIEAKQLGLQPVLIEKKGFTGGSFIGSEGLFAVGSHWQKEAGETATVEDFIKSCMEFHHWKVSPELYYNFFSRTADTIDWLEGLGVKFSEVRNIGNSPICWHLYEGTRNEGTGVTFMKSFREAADANDVYIRENLAGKKVLLDSDGKVSGVLALTTKGQTVQINAPVVIVGTGGYANNNDIIHELNGCDTSRIIPSGVNGRDGDGLKMLRDAGAAFAEEPGTVMFYGPIMEGTSYGSDIQAATAMQPILWINQDGKRYCNEALFWENFAYAGQAVRLQDKTFTIINKPLIDKFAEQGAYISVGVYYEAPNPMPKLWDQINSFVEAGDPHVSVADTIEELAGKIGVDPEALQETVDTYNGYCANGFDEQFLKDPAYLDAMDEGPFYAFEVYNGYFCTVGGIKITPNTEVVSSEGEIIPGLYAGGNDAGGLYGECYDVGSAAGSQASWAINSGRIAAQQAQAYLEAQGLTSVGEVSTEGSSDDGAVEVSDAVYKDGSYTAAAAGHVGDVTVTLTVSGGVISDISYEDEETTTIGGAALPKLVEEAVASNSADIDIVSGATDTSSAFIAAVSQCLEQAK